MTKEGWHLTVREAVSRADAGEPELLALLVSLLTEQDEAKQQLRDLGYGCIGRPWLDVVDDIRRGERVHTAPELLKRGEIMLSKRQIEALERNG